jgi:hypothetical protein
MPFSTILIYKIALAKLSTKTLVANHEAAADANPSAKALFEEVKQQYNNEFARKGTLETKANNIITIAGTIATLLFGFGTFLVDKLGSKYGLNIY